MASPSLSIPPVEIERRKDLRRRLFDYQAVDHLPANLWLVHSFGTTLREQLESGPVQFDVNVRRIQKSLELIPDDYIPIATVTTGYMVVATMFGAEVHWSDDPNQPPGIREHPIRDLAQIASLPRPTLADGDAPEVIRRIQYHTQNLPANVYMVIDSGGPMNTARDLLETNLLYTGFYDDPPAMHHLFNLATEVQIEYARAVIAAAGGIERMGNIDFNPEWVPEKYKGFSCDDVCSSFSPAIFKRFSLPYNNRIFEVFSGGGLHNCGPHPCRSVYLTHTPNVRYLNCSYRFTRAELPALRDLFAGQAIVEAIFDNQETPDEMLAGWREMMERLAPDTLGLPIFMIDDTWTDGDIRDFYQEARKIGEAWAQNMKWKESAQHD